MTATSFPADAGDWKGRFIYDQAAALARRGVGVELWAPPGELPPGVRSVCSPQDKAWLAELLQQGGIAHLLRRRPWTGVRAGLRLLRSLNAACRRNRGADFYLINWLQNALALPDDGKPAVVTVLGSDFGLLRLPGMIGALRRQIQIRPTVLAPNATWMAPRLRELFGDVGRIEPNPFGVASEWFGVERKGEQQRRGWLVVSRVTRAKLGNLFEWGEGLFSHERPLFLLGPMQEKMALPAWIDYRGATNPAELRERWFPTASGLLTLSRHDEGRPQVLIEAMAASLPVIASDLTAHADLIRHGKTGWLAGDRAAFVAALQDAENADIAAVVGAAARTFVAEHIGTWDDCAARYIAAAECLLEEDHAG